MYLFHHQSTVFNIVIMITIFLSAVTIGMETTSLRDSIPLFFIITDYLFLIIFCLEFVLKVNHVYI